MFSSIGLLFVPFMFHPGLGLAPLAPPRPHLPRIFRGATVQEFLQDPHYSCFQFFKTCFVFANRGSLSPPILPSF